LIEVFVRLGLALLLSMGLAVLLAWGWDSSDRAASGTRALVSAAPSQHATGSAASPATARSTE
jgi:hypothetical protein